MYEKYLIICYSMTMYNNQENDSSCFSKITEKSELKMR